MGGVFLGGGWGVGGGERRVGKGFSFDKRNYTEEGRVEDLDKTVSQTLKRW